MTANTLIETLKRLIAADPRSQSAIEKDSGIAVGQLSRLLNGKIENPSLAYLTGLSGTLNVSVAELLGEGAGVGEGAGAAADTGGLLWLTHDQVAPSPDNPRKHFDPDRLAELADSIAEGGLTNPLVVYDVRDEAGIRLLHAGDRRHRAIGLLIGEGRWDPARPIPCVPKYADAAGHLALGLIENLQREDLTPLEEARAFHRLIAEHGWTTADISKRIGKTQRHVQLRLQLVEKLAEPVQLALEEGRISLADARAVTVAPKAVQESALQAIEDEDYGWNSAENIRRNLINTFVPVGRNIFPLDDYDGEITEDPDDPEKRFFADRARFERLQRAAAEAKRDFMATKWTWADLIDRTAGEEFGRWDFDSTDEKEKGGAAVIIRHDWTVEVIEGLLRREPEKKPKADKLAGPSVTKAHMILCRNLRTRALQAELSARPDLAIRAAVLSLMAGGDCAIRLRRDELHADDRVETVTLDVIAARYMGPFEHLRNEHTNRAFGIDAWNKEKHAEAWEILCGLDDEAVAAMHAALIAALVGSWNHYDPALGDPPLALAIARTLEIDMAEFVDLDEAFLKTCRKDQLLEIARTANPGHDLRNIKTGDLIALIMAEAKDGGLDGHVPPTLNFGTPAEIEAAIAWPAPAVEGSGS